jgi:catechol 2,3-dioxygenase-like lactoylglutathione lyase family enzyme
LSTADVEHLVSARRFLHCCYCCDDLPSATDFLTNGLGLEVFMQTAGNSFDGSVLGLDGPATADVCFVYDHRGPRTSPAIEVQAWVDPPARGRAHASPTAIGVQALGVAVADIDAARGRAEKAGALIVGETRKSAVFGGTAVVVRDANAITFDLVYDADASDASRLKHVRVNCRDIDQSVRWYARLGFTVVRFERDVDVTDGAVGVAGRASLAELALPDEAMRLMLVEWLDPVPTGSHYPVANHRGLYRAALGVDDTRAAVAALERAGVAIRRQPQLLELAGTPVPDMWIAFLADPDQIPMELVERPRTAFR